MNASSLTNRPKTQAITFKTQSMPAILAPDKSWSASTLVSHGPQQYNSPFSMVSAIVWPFVDQIFRLLVLTRRLGCRSLGFVSICQLVHPQGNSRFPPDSPHMRTVCHPEDGA